MGRAFSSSTTPPICGPSGHAPPWLLGAPAPGGGAKPADSRRASAALRRLTASAFCLRSTLSSFCAWPRRLRSSLSCLPDIPLLGDVLGEVPCTRGASCWLRASESSASILCMRFESSSTIASAASARASGDPAPRPVPPGAASSPAAGPAGAAARVAAGPKSATASNLDPRPRLISAGGGPAGSGARWGDEEGESVNAWLTTSSSAGGRAKGWLGTSLRGGAGAR
mmetsp:Transcript_61571/g.194862  ORF Transcript_61571/g.194862 Transcript_61571/m.194862 type:complete len:226 (+) Transcript_61571:368-1045(+)